MTHIQTKAIWWAKWISTWMAIGCAFCAAMDWYPLNVWLGCLAGVGWTWVAWMWKENSLLLINVAMFLVYGFGVVRHLFFV